MMTMTFTIIAVALWWLVGFGSIVLINVMVDNDRFGEYILGHMIIDFVMAFLGPFIIVFALGLTIFTVFFAFVLDGFEGIGDMTKDTPIERSKIFKRAKALWNYKVIKGE